MKIQIDDQNLAICKQRSTQLRNVAELVRLSVYLIFRKIWRPQMILLILLGVASAFLLLALIFYDAGKENVMENKNWHSRKVNTTHDVKIKFNKNPFHINQHKKYPIYYDDGLRTEWNFEISKTYDENALHEWTEPPFSFKRLGKANYYGENGTTFVAPDDKKQLMEQLHKKHNYNLLASQMTSLHRSLPDLRFPKCLELSYPEKLPTTSVVIIFHNEAWSTLLRTIWSIIDRSPHQLLKEIILVDDLSTETELKRPLDKYIKIFPVRVEILRTKKREGLIRSRLIGAARATVR